VTSAPPVPDSAREVFGERRPLAVAYAEMLVSDGVTRGLIGPRETPRIWERHLLNCAVLTEAVERDAEVCDLGSGAGLPGLVMAIRRPDLRVTLVEPLLRRATFLTEAVERLGLGNVTVVRSRAEDLHGSAGFSVVASRAVAPLPRLLTWSLPLLQPGGAMLAMKGASAREEVTKARQELARWRVEDVEVLELGAPEISPQATVIRVRTKQATPLGWAPRKGRSR
jgi:16S rRNA (guanine527-N7)-methyltransferase